MNTLEIYIGKIKPKGNVIYPTHVYFNEELFDWNNFGSLEDLSNRIIECQPIWRYDQVSLCTFYERDIFISLPLEENELIDLMNYCEKGFEKGSISCKLNSYTDRVFLGQLLDNKKKV